LLGAVFTSRWQFSNGNLRGKNESPLSSPLGFVCEGEDVILEAANYRQDDSKGGDYNGSERSPKLTIFPPWVWGGLAFLTGFAIFAVGCGRLSLAFALVARPRSIIQTALAIVLLIVGAAIIAVGTQQVLLAVSST